MKQTELDQLLQSWRQQGNRVFSSQMFALAAQQPSKPANPPRPFGTPKFDEAGQVRPPFSMEEGKTINDQAKWTPWPQRPQEKAQIELLPVTPEQNQGTVRDRIDDSLATGAHGSYRQEQVPVLDTPSSARQSGYGLEERSQLPPDNFEQPTDVTSIEAAGRDKEKNDVAPSKALTLNGTLTIVDNNKGRVQAKGTFNPGN